MLVPLLDAASEQLPDFLANDGAGRDPSHGLGVPDRRSQFEYHLRTAANGMRGHAMPHMLLAALVEDTDRAEATRHLAAGRRLWRGPDLDGTMDEIRRRLHATQGG
jgi:hypothetical protein